MALRGGGPLPPAPAVARRRDVERDRLDRRRLGGGGLVGLTRTGRGLLHGGRQGSGQSFRRWITLVEAAPRRPRFGGRVPRGSSLVAGQSTRRAASAPASRSASGPSTTRAGGTEPQEERSSQGRLDTASVDPERAVVERLDGLDGIGLDDPPARLGASSSDDPRVVVAGGEADGAAGPSAGRLGSARRGRGRRGCGRPGTSAARRRRWSWPTRYHAPASCCDRPRIDDPRDAVRRGQRRSGRSRPGGGRPRPRAASPSVGADAGAEIDVDGLGRIDAEHLGHLGQRRGRAGRRARRQERRPAPGRRRRARPPPRA